jgi:hypothetical protein
MTYAGRFQLECHWQAAHALYGEGPMQAQLASACVCRNNQHRMAAMAHQVQVA